MSEAFSRSELLLGKEAMEKLARSRVAVFGLGGVGGYTVEALARGGIGSLTLVDKDVVSPTNLNRQILATLDTLGQYKTEAARDRVLRINPACEVTVHTVFYGPDTAAQFDFSRYDYVVDAIDTVTGKLALVEQAFAAGTPVISCMGAGNKLDPTAFEVADIAKTSICPLARTMRKELRKRGITHLKVVYSREEPLTPEGDETPEPGRRQVPGSVSFVPAAAGLILAGEVIKDLTGIRAAGN